MLARMPSRGTPPPELPSLSFANPRAFESWLSKNHAKSNGLWIRMAKKSSGIVSITYPEAVETALCWGWIDGQNRRIDESWFAQKFTPRRPRSVWSKINCEKATALIAAGRMKPAGLAEVDRAKEDGRWGRAYDSPSRAKVPEDLAAALAKNAKASAFFERLDSRNRFAILHRIQTAKKPATRARRIREFVKLLTRREKIFA
jgi:uncharacterized protein YdeI (YjbR/CyaY-like superfamily)